MASFAGAIVSTFFAGALVAYAVKKGKQTLGDGNWADKWIKYATFGLFDPQQSKNGNNIADATIKHETELLIVKPVADSPSTMPSKSKSPVAPEPVQPKKHQLVVETESVSEEAKSMAPIKEERVDEPETDSSSTMPYESESASVADSLNSKNDPLAGYRKVKDIDDSTDDIISSEIVDDIKVSTCYNFKDGIFSFQSLENTSAKPIKLGEFECKYTTGDGEEIPFNQISFSKDEDDATITQLGLHFKAAGLCAETTDNEYCLDIGGLNMKADASKGVSGLNEIEIIKNYARIKKESLNEWSCECPGIGKDIANRMQIDNIIFNYSDNKLAEIHFSLKEDTTIGDITYKAGGYITAKYSYDNLGQAYISSIVASKHTVRGNEQNILMSDDDGHIELFYNKDGKFEKSCWSGIDRIITKFCQTDTP